MMREAVAASVAAGDANLFAIEGAEISGPEDLVSDGVHLSTAGAARVAEELVARISLL
jgi:lysophospholipase L1-like esterase